MVARTVGELIATLKDLPADAPLKLLYEGRCCTSDSMAVLGLGADGDALLDCEGDTSAYVARNDGTVSINPYRNKFVASMTFGGGKDMPIQFRPRPNKDGQAS